MYATYKPDDMYATYECEDVPTGLTWRDKGKPKLLKTITEEVEMYKRHKPAAAKFSIIELGTYEELKDKYEFLERTYSPHYFNAALKSGTSEVIFIPTDPIEFGDISRTISSDHLSREKWWAYDTLDVIADDIYKQSISHDADVDKKDSYKIVGSLCHRGFVNELFDTPRITKEWINTIGDHFDEAKFKNIKDSPYYKNSIYEGGFSGTNVRKLCIYCEKMFGVSRYEVAKLFPKRDPSYFIGQKNGARLIAGLYAENGDYETALTHYRSHISTIKDKRTKLRFEQRLEEFIRYYQETGTSILSWEL